MVPTAAARWPGCMLSDASLTTTPMKSSAAVSRSLSATRRLEGARHVWRSCSLDALGAEVDGRPINDLPPRPSLRQGDLRSAALPLAPGVHIPVAPLVRRRGRLLPPGLAGCRVDRPHRDLALTPRRRR